VNDKSGIAQVDKPVQLTWRNRRVRSKENNNGEFFFIAEFEFDEEAWGYLKTIPRNANGEMVIWVTDVGMVTEKPKKVKPSKGPYGQLWNELFLSGIVTKQGVHEAIEDARVDEAESAWEVLHRVFGVEGASLSAIGPDEIYAKWPPNEYPAVKTMVEQAARKAGGQN